MGAVTLAGASSLGRRWGFGRSLPARSSSTSALDGDPDLGLDVPRRAAQSCRLPTAGSSTSAGRAVRRGFATREEPRPRGRPHARQTPMVSPDHRDGPPRPPRSRGCSVMPPARSSTSANSRAGVAPCAEQQRQQRDRRLHDQPPRGSVGPMERERGRSRRRRPRTRRTRCGTARRVCFVALSMRIGPSPNVWISHATAMTWPSRVPHELLVVAVDEVEERVPGGEDDQRRPTRR